jgi:DivIVA domain-containing protein
MALTPEDVVNKRFQPTKFREGYDQDEVDDFLDEVVVELRRLNQENEELRQRLVASDGRINELQRSAASAPPAPAFAAAPAAPEPFVAPAPAAPAFAAPAAPSYAAPAVDANPMDPGNTNNLLQLARRLHEEHVREGVEKRDALIAEGQTEAQRVVQEAEQSVQAKLQDAEQSAQAKLQEADQAVQAKLQEADQAGQARFAEIEQQQRAQLAPLQQERTQLEARVEELRNFEREYRQKLKGYIEGQLRDLENVNLVSTGATTAPAAAPAGPSYQASSFDSQSFEAPAFDAPAFDAPSFDAPTPPPASYPGFAQS